MENTKIIKRDMYNYIAETMKTGECPVDPQEVIAFCENEIALLDKKAAKAKERAATKAAAVDELTEQVYEVLSTDEFMTIADVTAKVAETNADVTVSKVSYRLSKLTKADKLEKTEVTIAASEGGKSRKVVAYRKIAD